MSIFFFFNDTATTEIYTLSLHDALPISSRQFAELGYDRTTLRSVAQAAGVDAALVARFYGTKQQDRKSTRLNSSHANISYAVFCLKKKKTIDNLSRRRVRPITRPSNVCS